MKAHLLLISHGNFASEALKTAEMIVGSVENASAISMTMEEGGEGLRGKLDAAFLNIENDMPVIIMVDIISGTPCNIAVETMYQKENVRVITGLNLAMIIEYAVSLEEDPEKLVTYLVESTKEVTKVIHKSIILEGDYEE